jgi:hypothetical protein
MNAQPVSRFRRIIVISVITVATVSGAGASPIVGRVATRSIPVGEAPFQGGTIQSVDGQYARWNRGKVHGVRPGWPVRIFRQGHEIGHGRATDVRRTESDIEIDSVSGVAEISVGDEVQVEMGSLSGDVLQP